MAKPLVIVESPAKAKTLGRFLGNRYRVEASYGHIRDLPESAADVPKDIKEKEWGRLGVDVESDFTPYYVVPSDKRKQVAHLKTAVKDASELLLATDPDREGESISWHLAQVLKPKIPVHRIVFHEITEDAVKEALEHPSDVNENLVRAQESRRILDRLYGYTLSPVLWKKVQTGLSAGRVQSVAVRLIVDREEERLAFRASRYSDLNAQFTADGRTFGGTLTRLGDVRVASGKDFDQQGVLVRQERAPAVGRRCRQRLVAQRGRVGAVVGDVAILKQPLRSLHRALRRETEFAARLLREGRRRERRRRTLDARLRFNAGDRPGQVAVDDAGESGRVVVRQQAHVLAGERAFLIEILAAGDARVPEAGQRAGERPAVGGKLCVEVGVPRRAKCQPLFFAVDDEPDGDALHAARAQPGLHLLPQDRR